MCSHVFPREGHRGDCGIRGAGKDATAALRDRIPATSLQEGLTPLSHKPAQGLALESLSKTRTENEKKPSKAVETISCGVNYCQHYK